MINRTLWLTIIGLAALSCSPENLESKENQQHQLSLVVNAKVAAADPANPLNPYDLTGEVHNELLLAYLENHSSTTLPAVILQVEALATNNNEFGYLALNPYLPITPAQQDLIAAGNAGLALNNTILSPNAKISLGNFLSTLLAPGYETQNYKDILAGIVTYEAAISANSEFTANDKKVILTTTSIARYAVAHDKGKGKDKDWRLSVNNLTAAANGATESAAKAVTMSMVAGIYNPNL